MVSEKSSELVRWLYLDMNSFFASVEQEMNPALRGKPVAVVPMRVDTTCCIAVSYEGKAFGVKTGTSVAEAKKLCPKMIFIEGNHADYLRYHLKIIEAVESCLPVEAVCSIDEIACRLTGTQQNVENARVLSLKIKAAIRNKVGVSLKCSIGVAPNRYLAKIAADMNKPDGFTILRPCDLPHALYALLLRDLPGVGERMESRLRKNNISSLQQLCSFTAAEMTNAWGSKVGEDLWHHLRGHEQNTIATEQKSISHSHVLSPELRHEMGALKVLKKLISKAALRLRQAGLYSAGMQIYVKFLGQDSWKASCGLQESQDTLVFLNALALLWKELPPGSIYAVGVVLTKLVHETLHSPSLFDDPRREKLVKTIDQVNQKFGKDSVHFGATHESAQLAPLRIAFTRIPSTSEI